MQDAPGIRMLAAGLCLIGGIGLIGLPLEATGLLRYLGGVILVGLALLFLFGRRTF